jgi:hypothetical protein
MKFFSSLNRKLRNLAKRSQLVDGLYRWLQFYKASPLRDILNPGKGIKKFSLIVTAKPYTVMNYQKLAVLYELARRQEKAEITGSFVECGVQDGGSAAVIAAAARHNPGRHVWLFDSWEGWPTPDEIDYNSKLQMVPEEGGCLGSEDRARKLLFGRLRLDAARVHLIKGWFADTLPRKETGKISLLHLDSNLYASMKYCLEQLYDDVTDGGYIIIDDYGYFTGCEKALTEFMKSRNLNYELAYVGKKEAAYFRKEARD